MKKHVLLAVAVVLLCVLVVGGASATEGEALSQQTLQQMIDTAEDEATLELEGDYTCEAGLTITKNITITAKNKDNMPKISITGNPNNGNVGAVQISVKNVTLSYLNFTTTQDQLFYVQTGTDSTKTVIIDHCEAQIPGNNHGHFYGDSAGTACNIVLTNNKVTSPEKPNLAIYFNVNQESTYKVEGNIFPECEYKEAGMTAYYDLDGTTVDISKNYWGGITPDVEYYHNTKGWQNEHVGTKFLILPYYTTLKTDGTIDTTSESNTILLTTEQNVTGYAEWTGKENSKVLTIKKEGEYKPAEELTAQGITISAKDVTLNGDNKQITAQQIIIDKADVTLKNLNFKQTVETSNEAYAIQVTADGTEGKITVTDSVITPVENGRGFTNDAGAAFDITFTGNTVKATTGELALAIYINGYNKKYVFTNNIIDTCSVKQFGFDQYVDSPLTTPADISKNYWGGSKPSLDLFVKSHSGKPDITGEGTYYTEVKPDGTINTNSIAVQPEEKEITVSGDTSTAITLTGTDSSEIAIDTAADSKKATLDFGSGIKMTITAPDTITSTGGIITIPAGSKITVTYPKTAVENEGTESNAITFDLTLGLSTVVQTLPTITPEVDEDAATKIKEKNSAFKLAGMVGATYAHNDNLDTVTIVFRIPVSWMPNADLNKFLAFHIANDDAVTSSSCSAMKDGTTYVITVTSTKGFSHHAVGYDTSVQPAPSFSSGDGNMENAFRVLFETSGGSFISPSTGLSYGDKISQPPAPTKDGYTFGGWYTDSACTQSWSFASGINGDMTLYAKWTKASGSTTTTTAKPTATATKKPTSAPVSTQSQNGAATTAAPVTTTAAGVTPVLTQAPAPAAGLLFGLLAAGILIRRRD